MSLHAKHVVPLFILQFPHINSILVEALPAFRRLCNISLSDSLCCSDHNIVEFGIFLSMLKVSSKTKGLDFRRADFSVLRASWEGSPGKLSWRIKATVSAESSSTTLS